MTREPTPGSPPVAGRREAVRRGKRRGAAGAAAPVDASGRGGAGRAARVLGLRRARRMLAGWVAGGAHTDVSGELEDGGAKVPQQGAPTMAPGVAKASDPTQMEAKEVRLSDIAPITLDDTDVRTVNFIYSDWDLSSCYFAVKAEKE
ncbi:hypothetical protein ZWY2020_033199 [Hordeum vulgare]|nr:hypothetical protein ZWY2020_033199 [Hordeum vulgare]